MKIKLIYTTLLIALIALTGFFSCNGVENAAQKPRPNVVIILTDDQGWGDLSVSGNPNLQTPHIDRLAQNGARFDRFYVSPVCSPTRAELLTGRYHPRSNVFDTSAGGERMDLDETTIADVFKTAGYATGAFGKWHNGGQPPYHPNARGFDEFYGFCSGHWGDYFDSMLIEHNGELVQGQGYMPDDLTDKAMAFMETNQEKPFFLYVPLNTPHSPMQVPDEYWEEFENKSLEADHPGEEKENEKHTKAALAMCENIDMNVGRIMEKLRELKLEENTIVLYMSDNGPNGHRWNGGMKGIKGSTDEGGVRSPLFVHWAGVIQPGAEVREIAAGIDLLPTLADLAGIAHQTAKPLDGVSLKPLLLNEQEPWPDRLIYSHWNGRTSVRSPRYRLDHQGALFDMEQDPGQTTDIAEQQPAIAQSLRDSARVWNETVLAELTREERPFPVGHPDFKNTQLPARDGTAHGNIQRSNRFPNSSFFTNWKAKEDKITWDIDVLTTGSYAVELYYTCPPEDVGATVELRVGSNNVTGKVTEAHNPPLQGMEQDRVPRMESYVKNFRPLRLGTIRLEKGSGQLTLQALEIPGSQVMDFRLLKFTRVDAI